MAWFSGGAVSVIERPSPVVPKPEVPRPVALVATTNEPMLAEYAETAKELGFAPAALVEARLRAFLREQGVRVYGTEDVGDYLGAMFPDEKRWPYDLGWQWHPLRQRDLDLTLRLRVERDGYWRDRVSGRVYQQAVPLPVLYTIQSIEAKFPDAGLGFYVSGKAEPASDDPFLMVMRLGMAPLVIERWDEPGFRG